MDPDGRAPKLPGANKGLGGHPIVWGLKKLLPKDTFNKLFNRKRVEGLTSSQQRAIRGLEGQVSTHQKKLADYKVDPDAFDNKGFLKSATPELRDKIIQSRIKSLEKQIKTFNKDINAIKNGVKKVLEKD